ncbi:hypothetical protein [Sandaracinobacteroides saxicola]|uniref:Uncharacterized protein n=1 Tax=Sandaracinobacteroides saxicola TaxID=2759707 RepID=A0A7G5IEV3_9SPHN|nr:hypothetical protein [Sandaracinobacteroides saxicola]QMW21895.1 hypothetical protein H3309_10920 [Sandaracinobacteroides saxicola]
MRKAGTVDPNQLASALAVALLLSGPGLFPLRAQNVATGLGALAQGNNNNANGQGAVALGNTNVATGAGSVAIGDRSTANAGGASGAGAVAIGQQASAQYANSVALGSGSLTQAALAALSAQAAFNPGSTGLGGPGLIGEVSIGSSNGVRRITNLAAGSAGNDAVNVFQLQSLNNKAVNLGNTVAAGLGGGSSFNTSTGNLLVGLSYRGTNYSSVQAILSALDAGNVGIKYFRANSTDPDATATGGNAVAVGPNAKAQMDNSLAVGNGATSSAMDGIAIGRATTASAQAATAVGTSVTASGQFSTVVGIGSRAVGASSVAVGNTAVAQELNAIAIGVSTNALGTSAVAIGAGTAARGVDTVALGGGSSAAANGDAAMGAGAAASGGNSLALSTRAAATGSNTIAIGQQAAASAADAMAQGRLSVASAASTIAIGVSSSATGDNAIAMGTSARAANGASVAIGSQATVINTAGSGNFGVAIGSGANANSSASGGSSPIAIGVASNASGAGSQTAIGDQAVATGRNAIAIGGNAFSAGVRATGDQSTSIGQSSSSLANASVSLGNNANIEVGATGAGAFGNNATVRQNAEGGVAFGSNALVGTSASGGAAFGQGATVSNGATNGVAIGTNANAGATSAVAIGTGAQARYANSTAIGFGSQTGPSAPSGTGFLTGQAAPGSEIAVGSSSALRRVTNLADGAAPTDAATIAQLTALSNNNSLVRQVGGAPGTGLITVGAQTQGTVVSFVSQNSTTRTLTGLTPGAVTATSLDAISGSQLFSTNSILSQLGTTTASGLGGGSSYNAATGALTTSLAYRGTNYSSVQAALQAVDSSIGRVRYFNVNSALGDSSAVGANSLAVGPVAVANGASGVAIGNAATAGATGANVAIGLSASANGATADGGAVSIGRANVATGDGAVAIGDPNVATGRGALALGADNTARGVGSVALGADSRANVGGAASDVGAVALGSAANAQYAGSVALGSGSATGATLAALTGQAAFNPGSGTLGGVTPAGEVSVGASGTERRLTNVAAGAAATDAVNVSQLQSQNAKVNRLGNDAALAIGAGSTFNPATGALSAPSLTVGGTAYSNIGAAIAAQNSIVNTQGSSTALLLGGSTVYAPATGTISGSSFTVQGSSFGNVTAAFSAVDAALTSNVASITALNNGTAGLVRQVGGAPGSGTLTVGAQTAGTLVDFRNSAGATRTLTGLSNGAVTATSTDAVNGSQLFSVAQQAGAGINVTTSAVPGSSGTASGSSVANVAPGGTATFSAGNNIAITQSGTQVQIATSLTPSFTSVTAGNSVLNTSGLTITGGPSVTVAGINAANMRISNLAAGVAATDGVNVGQLQAATGNVVLYDSTARNLVTLNPGGSVSTRITNLAAGTLSATSTDAVNGSQLFATNNNVTTAQNTANAAQTAAAAAQTTANTAQTNVTNLSNGINAGTVGLVQQVGGAPGSGALTVGAATGGTVVNLTGTAGTRTLTGVSAGALSATSTDAVNGSQLFTTNQTLSTVQATANRGFDLTTSAVPGSTGVVSGSSVANVAPGQTATFSAGNNVVITQNGRQVAVATSLTPSFTSVTAGNSVLNTSGLTITGGPSVTVAGINAANTRLTNLSAGVAATDGVNVGQLQAATGNVVVYDSATRDLVTLNPGGSSTRLTNLAAGTLSATSTDAVNGSQLFATNNNVTTAQNAANAAQATANTAQTGLGNVASLLAGGAAYNPVTGVFTAPVFTIQGANAGTVAGGFALVDAQLTTLNSVLTGSGIKFFRYGTPGTADATASGVDALAAGGLAVASGVRSTAVGNGATARYAGAVALGAGSSTGAAAPTGTGFLTGQAAPSSEVSVGNGDVRRRITNVADGSAASDAVTVAQLTAENSGRNQLGSTVASALGGGAAYNAATGTLTAPTYTIQSGNFNNVGAALGAVNTTLTSNIASITALNNGTAGLVRQVGGAPGSGVLTVGAQTAGTVVNFTNSAAATRTLTGVSAGALSATSTDAVNGSQLFAVQATANRGFDLTTSAVPGSTGVVSGSSVANVAPGQTATFSAGNNIVVTQNGRQVQIATSLTPSFTSVTAGNSVLNTSGLTITGGPSVTVAGINAANMRISNLAAGVAATDGVNVGQLQAATGNVVLYDSTARNLVTLNPGGSVSTRITNLAAGTLSATSTDAVNGSQLFATNNILSTLGGSVASGLGGGSSYNAGTGALTTSLSYGGTSYSSVQAALSAIEGQSGGIKYFRANSVLADAAATGTDSVAIGPLAGASAPEGVSLGRGAATSGGRGATALGSGTSATQFGSTAVGYQASAGTGSATAVGYAASATAGATAVGRNTSATGTNAVALGTGTASAASNTVAIGRTANSFGGSGVAIGLNAVAGQSGAAAVQNGVAVGSGAVASGGNAVALGQQSAAAGADAVALGNSASASAAGAAALGISAEASGANALALGANSRALYTGAVAIGRGSETGASAPSGTAFLTGQAAPASEVSFGTASAARRLTNVADGSAASDAVTVAQLTAENSGRNALGDSAATLLGGSTVYDPVTGVLSGASFTVQGSAFGNVTAAFSAVDASLTNANRGFDLTTAVVGGSTGAVSGSSVTNITPGSTATFSAGNNVVITQNGAEVQIATSLTPSFTSVTAGGSVLDTSGLTISGGPSVTVAGINAAGTIISNVAAGVAATDAVNVGQLQAMTGNVVVYDDQVRNGVTFNPGGSPAKLSNVAPGALNATSTDAVNGSQLFATNTQVATNTTDIATNTANIGTLTTNLGTFGNSTATLLGAGTVYDPATGTLSGSSFTVQGAPYATVGAAFSAVDAGLNTANSNIGTLNNGLAAANANIAANTANIATNTADITGLSAGTLGLVQQAGGAPGTGLLTVGAGTGGTQVDFTGAAGTRTLTGLTAGVNPTDAVNVSQLSEVAAGAVVNYSNVNSSLSGPGSNTKVNPGATGAESIAIGGAASAAGSSAMALGLRANASAADAVALGNGAVADAAEAVAIGLNATATGGKAVSIGSGNIATGNGAVAIGDPNVASGTGAIALGADNTARGVGAVALGNQSQANAAGAATDAGAVAIGNQANARYANSLALGSGSTTGATLAALTAQAAFNPGTAALSGTAPVGELSVGAGGSERRITNLAAGSAATDAVNVSQLQSQNAKVNQLGNDAGLALGAGSTYDPLTGGLSAPSFTVGGASFSTVGSAVAQLNVINNNQGTSTATLLGGTTAYDAATGLLSGSSFTVQGSSFGNVTAAFGAVDTALSTANTNIGNLQTDLAATDAQVAVNTTNIAGNTASINALNNGTAGLVQQVGGAPGSGNLTVGAATGGTLVDFTGTGGTRTLTGVSAGALNATSTDAVNGSQLFATNQTLSTVQATANRGFDLTTAVVGGSTGAVSGSSVTNITPGSTATFSAGNNVVITQNGAEVQIATSLTPSFTSVTAGGSVLDTSGLTISGGPSVTVAGINAAGTIISNVAAGVNASDAVNLAQLQAVGGQAGNSVQYDSAARTSVTLNPGGVAATLTNVAPGALNATSSDAVNGSQLFATNNQVATNTADIGTLNTGLAAANAGIAANTAGIGALTTNLGNLGSSTATLLGAGTVYDPATGTLSGSSFTVQGAPYGTVGAAFSAVDAGLNTANTNIGTLTSGLAATNAQVAVNTGNIATNTADIATLNSGLATATTNIAGNTASINALNNGTAGLVQQVGGAPGSGNLTVGAATGGTLVDFTGTGGTRTLTGVSAGALNATSTDAVNGSQLFATNQTLSTVQATANRGFDLTTAVVGGSTGAVSGSSVTNITPGSTATFSAGNNVVITQNGAEVQIATSLTPSFTSVTAGGSVLDTSGLTISGGPSVTVAGINAAGTIISNVAAGVNASDAVNLAQLQAVGGQAGNSVQYDSAARTSVTLNPGGVAATLTNVAPGALNATSSDAVNGSQLFATNNQVATNTADIGTLNTGLAAANAGIAANTAGIGALNTGLATANSNIAANSSAIATNTGDIATLNSGLASTNAQVATNTTNIASNTSNIAALNNGTAGLVRQVGGAPGSGEITVGAETGGATVNVAGTEGNRRITNVAAGVAATDAANVGQLQAVAGVAANAVAYDDPSKTTVTFNPGGAPTRLGNVADGSAPNDAVNFGQLTATNTQVSINTAGIAAATAGLGSLTNNINNGTIGLVQQIGGAPGTGTLTVGAATAGSTVDFAGTAGTRRLTSLSAGQDANDAVNVSQLTGLSNAAAAALGGGAAFNPVTGVFTPPSYVIGGVAYGNVGAALGAQSSIVSSLGSSLASSLGGGSGFDPASGTLSLSLNYNGSSYGSLQALINTLPTSGGGGGGSGPSPIAYSNPATPTVPNGGTATNNATLVGANPAAPVALTNVAAGNVAAGSTDAVNGGQLNDTNATVSALTAAITQGTIGLVQQAAPGAPITVGAATGGNSVNVAGSAGNRTIDGVANGALAANSVQAVNGSQLFGVAQQVASNTTTLNALSNGSAGAFQANNAAGRPAPVASGPNAVAGGFGAVASAANVTALGSNASASGSNSVALGAGSSDGGLANVVSVGAVGAERQIINVAAGTRATDAVNLSQLQGGLTTAVNQAQQYTDARIAGLRFDLRDLSRNAYAGTASAIALQPPIFAEPGQISMRLGTGFYRGQTALGVSVRATADNGRWSLSGGVAGSRYGGVAASAGIDLVLGQ